MEISSNVIYISSSLNPKPHCASWGKLLACGMNKSIVFVDQKVDSSQIIKQYTQHNDEVSVIKWLDENTLISGDCSGNIILWKFDENMTYVSHFIHNVDNDNCPISDISIEYFNQKIIIGVVSYYKLYILECDKDFNMKIIQCLNYGRTFAFCVSIYSFDESTLFISTGLDSGRVMFYVLNNNYELSEGVILSGHDDWVNALDIIKYNDDIYLSSASNDKYIRIWHICVKSQIETSLKNELDVQKLQLPGNLGLYIYLDGILISHTDFIKNCQFVKHSNNLGLVSFSVDKSIIVWERNDTEFSKWTELTRTGVVGGEDLGFFGGCASINADFIVGWKLKGEPIVFAKNQSILNSWDIVVGFGGHFGSVVDLSWENTHGRYLLSVGTDQTTRIHACCNNQFREVGRPQIHGYDMSCIGSLDSVTFVSGGDEKIARVFGMNIQFSKYLNGISDWSCPEELMEKLREETVSINALGLSAKINDEVNELGDVPNSEATLWPELTKLYGHGFELIRIGVKSGHGRTWIATSCKAQQNNHADIIIWENCSGNDKWQIKQRLYFHKQTVVGLVFDQNYDRLVSVSKDRKWALWVFSEETNEFQMVSNSTKFKKPEVHSRIIWDATWSYDSSCFVTVSRDCTAMVWMVDPVTSEVRSGCLPANFGVSINAIATIPVRNRDIFIVGLETGAIKVIELLRNPDGTRKLAKLLDLGEQHHDWITRLVTKPCNADLLNNSFIVASASKDRFVKMYSIEFKE